MTLFQFRQHFVDTLLEPEQRAFNAGVTKLIKANKLLTGTTNDYFFHAGVLIADKPMLHRGSKNASIDPSLRDEMAALIKSLTEARHSILSVYQALLPVITVAGLSGVPEAARLVLSDPSVCLSNLKPFNVVLAEQPERVISNWKSTEKKLNYLLSLRLVL